MVAYNAEKVEIFTLDLHLDGVQLGLAVRTFHSALATNPPSKPSFKNIHFSASCDTF